jgi:hypothetical protein
MSKVEWMDPPDARFRTDIDTGWAPELMDHPGDWARIVQDEDQRIAYQLRTNLKNRLSHLYPDAIFELICRRVDDGKITAIFARYTGVLGDQPSEEPEEEQPVDTGEEGAAG